MKQTKTQNSCLSKAMFWLDLLVLLPFLVWFHWPLFASCLTDVRLPTSLEWGQYGTTLGLLAFVLMALPIFWDIDKHAG